jgi:hypothetical protein
LKLVAVVEADVAEVAVVCDMVAAEDITVDITVVDEAAGVEVTVMAWVDSA